MINQSYLNTVKDVCEQIIDLKKNKKNIFFLISGPQGSGKSTFSFHVKKSLEKKKLKVLVLSIDNFYLSKNDRLNLSKKKDANKADAMLIASFFYENLRSD